MIKARTRRIIQGADYSAQEPRVLSMLCADEGMLQAYRDGKDLYVEIAAISLHLFYKECLEHFPKGAPIKNINGKWYYAKLKNGSDVRGEMYVKNLISEQGAKFNGTCYMDEQEQKYETNNIVEISNE